MSEKVIKTKSTTGYTRHTLVKSNLAYDSVNHRYDITNMSETPFKHRAIALQINTNKWILPCFDLQLISYIRQAFALAQNFHIEATDVLTSSGETSMSWYEASLTDTVNVYVFD